jgi:UDP-N-acetylglucosamine 2-epimerase (non-hydrolysing)
MVLRDVTERPEGLVIRQHTMAGMMHSYFEQVKNLLNQRRIGKSMAKAVNPYGDGKAARRIVDLLIENSPAIQDKDKHFRIKKEISGCCSIRIFFLRGINSRGIIYGKRETTIT